jgi:MFS transporter, PPP family, 3-phenylpropionic acid transporter
MPGSVSLRLSLFYAALFVVFGVQIPFWPTWLASRGLSPTAIGTLLAVVQWVRVGNSLLSGIAADRRGESRRIMVGLGLGMLAGLALLLPAQGFFGLMLLSAAAGACLAGLETLGTSTALAAAHAGRIDYGRVRLWGSITFILASLLGGELLEGRDHDIVLHLLIGGAVLVLLVTLARPRAAAARAAHVAGWRTLMRPRFLAFVAAATLVQGSHAVFYAFGTIHWQDLGLADTTIAALWSEGVIAEVLLFYCGARLLRRLSPLGLLALGGAAGVVRWTVTAFATALPVPAAMQLLHALTFAAAHLGAMHHLVRTVPPGRAVTGQAVLGALGGLGMGLITLLAGEVYGAVGSLAYLAMAAIAALGGLSTLALMAVRED